MVQIAMLVCGIATGLLCKTWKQAMLITLAVFAVTLAVQTAAVASENGLESGTDVVVYGLIQVVSLAVAMGIARILVHRRQRRGVTV